MSKDVICAHLFLVLAQSGLSQLLSYQSSSIVEMYLPVAAVCQNAPSASSLVSAVTWTVCPSAQPAEWRACSLWQGSLPELVTIVLDTSKYRITVQFGY